MNNELINISKKNRHINNNNDNNHYNFKKKKKKPIEYFFRKNDGINWFYIIDGHAINKKLREMYRNKVISDNSNE